MFVSITFYMRIMIYDASSIRMVFPAGTADTLFLPLPPPHSQGVGASLDLSHLRLQSQHHHHHLICLLIAINTRRGPIISSDWYVEPQVVSHLYVIMASVHQSCKENIKSWKDLHPLMINGWRSFQDFIFSLLFVHLIHNTVCFCSHGFHFRNGCQNIDLA